MSKVTKLLSINEAISQCGYNNNMKQKIMTFLKSNYSNQKSKLYLFQRNDKVPKLFLLLLKIPGKYKNNTYDISILIYFPLNFPLVQPDIFFHKYCCVKINPSCLNYIDEETLRINYEKFYKWGYSFESFKNLIKEIYNKFNKNFPIFTLNKKEENDDDEGDCYLKEQCCKEIEFKNTVINKNNNNNQNNNRKTLKTQNNNNKIKNTEYSPNHNNNDNTNLINKETLNNKSINKSITYNKNDQLIHSQKNLINQNKNNIKNNSLINDLASNKNDDESLPYDEHTAKDNIIQLLISQLYPEINRINISVFNTKIKLDKTKNNIISEMKEFEEMEKQRGNVEKSINLIKNELRNYNINKMQSNKKYDESKKDFSNLDTFLNIKNKKYYNLLSKERAIEEYILVLKKSYEKHLLDLQTAMNLVRINSRQIFYIKYKYHNLKSKNI